MTEQGDHGTYRVIAFGSDGTEILLTRSHSGLQFPEVMIPQWERVAENVTSAMERQWGEVVVCLFEPDSPLPAGSSRYIVARHWRPCGSLPTPPPQWTSMNELAANLFSRPDDYWTMHECRASVSDHRTGTFALLSWFEELCNWVGTAIAARGLHLTGDFRQFNASPTFSLIRFATNGPAVWFKAVGEPNEREYPITLKLASTFPKYMPELVAERSDWNGWLTCEAVGTNLAENRDSSIWESAASALASLQIESIGKCEGLVDLGARDLKATSLVETVSPFLEAIVELMSQQPKTPPPVLSNIDLAVLGERIRNAISTLQEFEIADTLGHLDLNPGNMIVGAPAKCTFLDWAEAYVGHPFYSFQYLLQYFRRMAGKDPVAEHAFTRSYLKPWSDIASIQSLAEAMPLAPLIAAFAYGAATNAWRTPERLRDPKVAGYLRALARRMKREADQLSERSAPCLS